jgi:hypothetical protein
LVQSGFQGKNMALSSAQLALLASDIAADPALASVPKTPDGAFEVANAYNLDDIPDYWVWKTALSKAEATGQVSSDGTTFSWTLYISREPGERDGFREMFASGDGILDASLPANRQGMVDVFSGPAGAPQRAHLAAIARRLATRAEALFAMGVGTTGAPSTMVFEGTLQFQDVLKAWAI